MTSEDYAYAHAQIHLFEDRAPWSLQGTASDSTESETRSVALDPGERPCRKKSHCFHILGSTRHGRLLLTRRSLQHVAAIDIDGAQGTYDRGILQTVRSLHVPRDLQR